MSLSLFSKLGITTGRHVARVGLIGGRSMSVWNQQTFHRRIAHPSKGQTGASVHEKAPISIVQVVPASTFAAARRAPLRNSSTASFVPDHGQIDAPVRTISAQQEAEEGSRTTSPFVAYHLFFCAALVYLIIVVGGLTRLTESGLSITEWNPGFKGMRMPWTEEEWNEEWEKYKLTPEWAILNRHMTVEDFKKIYMWEWSHRILGRLIGVAFVVPATYFVFRGQVTKGSRWKLLAIALGIGFQGALGWFMVQSGLSAPEATPPAISSSHPNSTVPLSLQDIPLDGTVSSSETGASTSSDWHPRVSHFRLAAHLGTAFLVYLGMLHTGMAIIRDHRLATMSGKVGGVSVARREGMVNVLSAMTSRPIGRLRNISRAMLCLTFVTAMTGALVAGLDAGLVYSEFPYMGEGFVPPREELLDPRYAQKDVRKDDGKTNLIIGNASQNPVTVQLIHRCMAMTTLVSALGLAFYTRRVSFSMMRRPTMVKMPPVVPRLANLVALAAVGQASLGISTLIYLVPIELASAHQAGSVALLSAIVALLAALRRPNGRILRMLHSSQSTISNQATIDRALRKVIVQRG